MAQRFEQIQNHALALQDFLSLERLLLLKLAHFSCVSEEAAVPEELISEQITALFDLKAETDNRIGARCAQASASAVQSVLSCFPAEP